MIVHDSVPTFALPAEYENDYQLLDKPLPVQCVLHQNGLVFRISWQCRDKFLPMSFLVNTSVPAPFYFTDRSYGVLKQHGLLHSDDDGNDFVLLNQTKGMAYRPSPYPVDMVGLRFLTKAGMTLHSEGFYLKTPDYF